MSKGLSQIEDGSKRIEIAKRRIKTNGKNPGLGTLAALDWQRANFQFKDDKRAS